MKAFKRARREEQAVGRGYQGYALAPLRGVGKVRYSDLSPEAFFRDYVAPRRPVVIDGCLCESEGWQGGKWTNQYLGDKAGDAVVKVEYRGGAEERFGQGRERAMKFGDFLGELERKSDLFYLTTQELGLDSSGRPRVMSAPLDKLKGDFPLRPALAGALVPQNVNLWMGHSKKGAVSSSGLHHDFHDNLYVLLRGKKTFRLFSPADAHRMYVEGELVKVHPNGRINYRGKETRADGSDPLAETAARAAELVDRAAIVAEEMATKAESGARMPVSEVGQQGEERETEQLAMESDRSEREVAAAQEALERGEDGAAERLAAAEEELERALEAVLDAECAGGGGFGEGGSDDESSDSDGGPGFFDGVNDNPSEEVFAAAAAAGRAGRLARENGAGAGAGGGEEGVEDLGSSGGDGEAVAATAKGKRKAGARKTAAAVAAAAISGGADEGRSCSDGGRVTAVPPEGGRGGSSGDGDSSAGDENEDGGAGGAQEEGAERGNGAADPEDGATLGPGAGETEADTAGDKGGGHDGGGGEEASDEKRAPSNFSKVDPSLPRAELAERFPLFLEAESCTVEVEAGQMLFLPAGWFHEVSSMAAEDGHMAFNYWFHPPDAVRASDHDGDDDDGLVDPSKPYESSFWQKDWESRLRDEAEEEEEEGGGASGVVAASCS